MKAPTEYLILLIIMISTSLSTLFCIVGLATPGWHFDQNRTLFCDDCPKMSNALALLSMILLIVCLIFLLLLSVGMIAEEQVVFMRLIIPSLLLLITILLLTTLIAYLNFVHPTHGYSFHLTIVAFLFAYVSALMAAFWLGTGSRLPATYSLGSQ